MLTCRYCNLELSNRQKLGGHVTWCQLNPNRENTIRKIALAGVGRKQPEEVKQRLAALISQKVAEGTWHNSFARSRKQTYKDEDFDGMWEVYLAQWFDSHDIEWMRNKASFPYVFDDKQRRYTPDFYLPSIDCYVEVKGWKTAKDEAKWAQFSERLIVLAGSDLQALGIPITVRKDWKQHHSQVA